ncbi:MAG: Ig-like domain-containing protein [Actinomycetota bacterium]|nr:Ig-like domain-containing protein [Actinomycetota bacterium]
MTKTNYFRAITVLGLAGIVALFLALAARPAYAATFTVDRTDDSATASACTTTPNDCSLRGAIAAANAASGPDTIDFASGLTTFTLNITGTHEDENVNGDLDVKDDLTIDGGSSGVTIEGTTGWSERVIDVIGGSTVASRTDVTITEVTVRNGNATVGGIESSKGGGIQVNGNATVIGGASLTLQQSTVTDNTAVGPGGGIYDAGGSSITLQDSTVSNNTAGNNINGGGGGIWSTGPLTISDSQVTGNEGVDLGGGIFVGSSTTLDMTDSTVSGNTAASSGGNTNGGGIWSQGSVTLTRSTLSNNTAESSAAGAGEGGALWAGFGSTTQIVNSTVSGNTAQSGSNLNADGKGGGIFFSTPLTLANATIAFNKAGDADTGGRGGGIFGDTGASTTLRNSIVAANSADNAANFAATPTSQGYNLLGENPGSLAGTDIVNSTPLLGPLANNGGPTQTHALQTSSPAIDAANPATPGSGSPACEATDQRGETRPQDGDGDSTARCDIGAFEKAGSGGGGDTTAPTVFSVNPSEGQTGVSRTTNITVTFSEAMDTSSFDTDTVKLTRGTTSIPVTMETSTDSSGRTVLTLNPFGSTTQKLGKRKTHTVRIEGAADTDGFAVEDSADNKLGEDKVWTFRTKRR